MMQNGRIIYTQIFRVSSLIVEGFVMPSYGAEITASPLKFQGPSFITLSQSPKQENWTLYRLFSSGLNLTS